MNIDLNIGLSSGHSETPIDVDTESENIDNSKVTHDDVEAIELQIEKKLEVGSVVESIDQAYLLYCEYARAKGFSVRKASQTYFSKTAEIRMKEFRCSCSGHSDGKRSDGRVADYKKQLTRSDCTARLRVVRERGGPWSVCRFYKDHNHDLVPSDQTYLLRSARNLSHAKMSVIEALNSAGIGISRACRFMEKECGGPQNVGFIRKDAYAHMSRLKMKTKVDNGDANALMQFFIEKSNKEPFFYWNVQTDDEGRLMNFFFRDSRSAVDYEYFGDVLSIDTTYRTNKYNLICAPFVGINHHMNNVMFGMAFLSDETTKSFEWLFNTFLESMYHKEPDVIFSDQCQALMNGVDYTFRTSAHRLCQWHINQNAPSHFGALNGNTAFKKTWHHLMNGCEDENEFELCWRNMIDNFELYEHRWLNNMYNLRKRWATCFTLDRFTAELHATSRSEVTNKVLKDLCSTSSSLYDFVMKYEQILNDWRTREGAEDTFCLGIPGQFVKHNDLLVHVSKVYTRNVYKMFEFEAAHSLNTHIMEHPIDYFADDLVFKVSSSLTSTRCRRVCFNKSSHMVTCSCRKFKSQGIFCRHILKIYYLMNVTKVPEKYLIKRWTRNAKLRIWENLEDHAQTTTGGIASEMQFVNHVMRCTYQMTQEAKLHERCRTLILDRIQGLHRDVNCMLQGQSYDEVRGAKASDECHDSKRFCNPKTINTRGYVNTRIQSHWETPRKRRRVDKKDTTSGRPPKNSMHTLTVDDDKQDSQPMTVSEQTKFREQCSDWSMDNPSVSQTLHVRDESTVDLKIQHNEICTPSMSQQSIHLPDKRWNKA